MYFHFMCCMFTCVHHFCPLSSWMLHKVGSVLRPTGGRGSDEGCFLQMTEDTTLQGFTIYYPEQVPDKVPVPYPWWAEHMCQSDPWWAEHMCQSETYLRRCSHYGKNDGDGMVTFHCSHYTFCNVAVTVIFTEVWTPPKSIYVLACIKNLNL